MDPCCCSCCSCSSTTVSSAAAAASSVSASTSTFSHGVAVTCPKRAGAVEDVGEPGEVGLGFRSQGSGFKGILFPPARSDNRLKLLDRDTESVAYQTEVSNSWLVFSKTIGSRVQGV